MFKKVIATLAMCFAAVSFAAVDANKGSAADLDGLKGVGPSLSKRILDARKEGEFKDWPDLMQRVKGVKEKSAAAVGRGPDGQRPELQRRGGPGQGKQGRQGGRGETRQAVTSP